MSALPEEAISQLLLFVTLVKNKPEILHSPELKFFKDFIESFGGKVPSPSTPKAEDKPNVSPKAEPTPAAAEPESEESDVELDNTGVIEPDEAEPLPDVDETLEVTDDQMNQSNEKKQEAFSALVDKDYNKAAELYTEAIKLNPGSALLYAKRGQCYLQLSKPNACIRDCSRALIINPDCGPAYKFRGRAHRLLGQWEEAAQDLRNACKIDFDEQADAWLREVTPNARKLEEHKLKILRREREKELNMRRERVRQMKEANEQAKKEFEDLGSGGQHDFFSMFNDPELMNAFKDPEVAMAFQDISQNPSNYVKYLGNPKVVTIIEKLSGKYGRFTEGFPGATPPPPPSTDDTELD